MGLLLSGADLLLLWTGKRTIRKKRLVNREDQHSGNKFPLVEMLHSCTPFTNKKNILSSFQYEDGIIRVLVATIVFGVRVNCQDVHGIIQYYSQSKFMLVKPRQKRQNLDIKPEISDCAIERVRDTILLGVVHNENLT